MEWRTLDIIKYFVTFHFRYCCFRYRCRRCLFSFPPSLFFSIGSIHCLHGTDTVLHIWKKWWWHIRLVSFIFGNADRFCLIVVWLIWNRFDKRRQPLTHIHTRSPTLWSITREKKKNMLTLHECPQSQTKTLNEPKTTIK